MKALSRRSLRLLLIPGLALVAFSFWACRLRGEPREIRNLVLVVIDTLRADHVGSYGYQRPTTPNLDRLAEQGSRFSTAIASAPWTRPSMATLLTGLHGSTTGLTGHNFRVPKGETDVLPGSVTTLAEVLRQNGFDTAGVIGNINVDPVFGFHQGFQDYANVPKLLTEGDPQWRHRGEWLLNTTRRVSDEAIRWLQEGRSRKPFLLFLHYLDPHEPYQPPATHLAPFPEDAYQGSDKTRNLESTYDGEVRLVDAHLQRVLDELTRAGLMENTGIVIVSDHGEEFADHGGYYHGHTMWDEMLLVPLVMVLPGLTEPGTVLDQQVRLLDVMPTLLEALEVRSPPGLQGTSLVPLLRGGELPELPAFSELGYTPLTSLRLPPWKLIHDPETGHSRVYHLEDDPGETRNLARKHPEVTARMEAQLRSIQEAAVAASRDYPHDQGEVALTQDKIEQLEAIGYLGN